VLFGRRRYHSDKAPETKQVSAAAGIFLGICFATDAAGITHYRSATSDFGSTPPVHAENMIASRPMFFLQPGISRHKQKLTTCSIPVPMRPNGLLSLAAWDQRSGSLLRVARQAIPDAVS
jgi:hypothetical protein